jgi:hypothetical protein
MNGEAVDWPSWISAGSSIIAIFVAFYVPIRLYRNDKKLAEHAKEYRAHSIAITVMPDITHLLHRLEKMDEILLQLTSDAAVFSEPGCFDVLRLDELDSLDKYIEWIPDLGPSVAPDLLQLMAWGKKYNQFADSVLAERTSAFRIEKLYRLNEPMAGNREMLLKLAKNVHKNIVPIHDKKYS